MISFRFSESSHPAGMRNIEADIQMTWETTRWTFPEITPVVNGYMLPYIGMETARRQRMSGYWAMSNKDSLSGGEHQWVILLNTVTS